MTQGLAVVLPGDGLAGRHGIGAQGADGIAGGGAERNVGGPGIHVNVFLALLDLKLIEVGLLVEGGIRKELLALAVGLDLIVLVDVTVLIVPVEDVELRIVGAAGDGIVDKR